MLNEDVVAALGALLLVMNIANILFTWWRTRDQAVEKRNRALESRFQVGSERMDRLDNRLGSVEQSLRGLPNRDDLHELHLSMREMQGDMKTLTAIMEGNSKIMGRLETIVGRHEQHLLDGGRS